MRRQLAILTLTLISGCSLSSPFFLATVRDHRTVTAETNAAIINTLQDECESETDLAKVEACDDLIERLRVISRQAVAIEKYVMHRATEEDLALYLRSKWRINP